MSQDVMNQYLFKINDVKLHQDLKIMRFLRDEFQNNVGIQERKFQYEMLSFCNSYSSKDMKTQFEACKAFNSKLVGNFNELGREFIGQARNKYESNSDKVKQMAYAPADRQAFYMVVDFESMVEDKLKVLGEEMTRIKVGRFTQNGTKK